MKILVAGATGRTGQHVVRFLHEAGHTVHAMVRKPEQRDAMAALGAEPVFGDFTKPLGYTLQGCRGAVFVAGARDRANMSEIEMVEHTGAFTFVETCRRLTVRRLVMLSVQGAHDPEAAPEQTRDWVRLKGDTDQFIRENKLDFTIVRATALGDEPATGLIKAAPVLPAPEGEIGDLSREDVAKVLALAVDDRNLFDRSFDIMPGDTPIAEAMGRL
ncbi:MAG: NAD(P)H-binding protein [Alphaproteobacteria bacterium]|jgi:uncharacterized protein YbjT (DUF2867 family)|nr:NAD(P)H-binding protein [Alphaproteobacteria bacterium]